MITAEKVKELREVTGVGMMDCKKALSETAGDMDAAIEYLRKQGLKSSANKAGRIATDGLVATYLDGNQAVMVELNCETDFVAKNEDLVGLANNLSSLIAQKKPVDVDATLTLTLPEGVTVGEKINLLIAKLGEKLSFRRFISRTAGPNEKIGTYIHLGNKIGVLIALTGEGITDSLLKDLAMHVAAVNPRYLTADQIPQDVIAKEKDIYREQLKDSGKPANVIEKILEGKISKFASEVCLQDQVFIKDPTGKKTIAQVLKEVNPALKISFFTRYQVGEGMEKKKEDFAEEVAKMVK